MKNTFITLCVTAIVVLHEGLNYFLIAMIVGDYEWRLAAQDAIFYSNMAGSLWAGSIRAIPFISLILLAKYTTLYNSFRGRFVLYQGFIVSVYVIFTGYWSISRPLFTDEHASSTAPIGYLIFPVMALFYSMLAAAITLLMFKVRDLITTHRE